MRAAENPATILIVDDNPDNLFVLDNLLTHVGHRVIQARDGAEALRLANTECPDLVLMDLDMPIMDGWEASRRLRESPQTSHLPIIALSAHALLGDQERTLGDCCDEFIAKPFAPTNVLAKIERFLSESKGE
jgi:two-component system, cell cycle response regulator DivK